MKTEAQNIIDGDGSMQMRLDAGLCPKCNTNLSLNKTDGTISCLVCGLGIVDTPSYLISYQTVTRSLRWKHI